MATPSQSLLGGGGFTYFRHEQENVGYSKDTLHLCTPPRQGIREIYQVHIILFNLASKFVQQHFPNKVNLRMMDGVSCLSFPPPQIALILQPFSSTELSVMYWEQHYSCYSLKLNKTTLISVLCPSSSCLEKSIKQVRNGAVFFAKLSFTICRPLRHQMAIIFIRLLR